jgi:predicted ester cyclase
MQVHVILYKSSLGIDRVRQLFRERSSKYRSVAGLREKLYVHDVSSGEVGGIYLFESSKALEDFRQSELEASIRQVYQFSSLPTIRTFDVVHTLYDGPKSTAREQTESSHAAIVRRVLDDGLNHGRVDELDQWFAAEYVDHQEGIAPPTLAGVKTFITAARTAFPDLRLTLDEVTTAGDRIWVRSIAQGTHRGMFMGIPPTGRSFIVTRFDLCRFENGKITEHWGLIDRLALLRQLGAGLTAPVESSATHR